MATRCVIADDMNAYFDFYIHTICFDKRSKLLLFSPLFWSILKISVFCLKNEYQDMTTRSAKLEFIRYLPDSREKMRRLNFHLDLTSILLHLHKKILMIFFLFSEHLTVLSYLWIQITEHFYLLSLPNILHLLVAGFAFPHTKGCPWHEWLKSKTKAA